MGSELRAGRKLLRRRAMRRMVSAVGAGSPEGWAGLEMLEQRLLLATWYVSDVTDPAEDGSADHPFDSIQEGIDVAVGGDTIEVADGTYTEDLLIGKGVTVRSASGAANTTIQLVDGVGIDITLGGAQLGASGQGFTVLSDAANTTAAVRLADGVIGTSIIGNIIDTSGAATQGVSALAAVDMTVEANEFRFDTGDVAVTFNPRSTDTSVFNLDITDNAFTVTGGESSNAVELGNFSNATISGNTLEAPIVLYVGGGGFGSDGLTITQNTFTPMGDTSNGNGILLGREDAAATGQLSNLSVIQNDFTDRWRAVEFYADAGNPAGSLMDSSIDEATLEITDNILDTLVPAVMVFDPLTFVVDASGNWWGSATPADVAAQAGDRVDYTPWLASGVDSDAELCQISVFASALLPT